MAQRSAAEGAVGSRVSMPILSVVIVYAVFAALWILLSDRVVTILFKDPVQIAIASTVKGWLFVAITSLLLYTLMQRVMHGRLESPAAGDFPSLVRSVAQPLIVLTVSVIILTGIGITHNVVQQTDKEISRLQVISQLKADQIQDWLDERRGDIRFLQTSTFLTDRYAAWRQHKDKAALAMLLERLGEFAGNYGYRGVLLLDEHGLVVTGAQGASQVYPPHLLRGLAGGRFSIIGPYRDAEGHLQLDFVTPLRNSGAFLVLRIDPTELVYPRLQAWPAPSESGESLLFRRDADDVLYLSDVRHRSDAAANLRLPAAADQLLEARVLRGEVRLDGFVEGTDYRGAQVVGVAHAVDGTDWFLLAKLDKQEMYAEAIRHSVWIGLAGLLALFAVAASVFALRQRQQLALVNLQNQAQAEKMRPLQLLNSIVTNSSDVIFAKDLEGRYMLFNPEAARLVGKTPAEVIGRDDSAILQPEEVARVRERDRQVIAEQKIVTYSETFETVNGERTFLGIKGPLRDAAGKVVGVYGIYRDVTEREQAARALRESEERYRFVLDNAADAVFVADSEGSFRYVNQRAADLLGYGIGELLARGIRDLTPVGEADTVMEVFRHLLEAGSLLTEARLLRKDEAIVTVELNAVRLPDGNVYGACRDIGERRRVEAALRERDALLRDMSAMAHIGGWGFDTATGEGEWTEEIARICGVDPALPTNREFGLTFFEGEHRKRIETAVADAMAHGHSYDLELELTTPAGERKWVRTIGRPVIWEGQVVKVRGAMQDITDRKRAEAAVRESEERWIMAVDSAGHGVWDWNRQDNRVFFSHQWKAMLGYADEEIGSSLEEWSSRVHPEDVASCYQALEHHFAGETPTYRAEFRMRSKDGQYLWILDQGRVVSWSEDMQPLRMIGTHTDITPLRQAESELRKLFLAVEQSPESIVITDLEARIEYVNEAFLRVTGYRREEVIGSNPRILQSGTTMPGTYEAMWAALKRGEPWKGEFHNRRKDGREYVEFAVVAPIRQADGRITHYVAVKEDITEKKRTGEELDRYRHRLEEIVASRTAELLEARERAEVANQAKSAFLANMSHEIRTPMNAILGLTHLLRRATPNGEQLDKLGKIDAAARHLLALLNDILDLSKIEAGRLQLEDTEFAPEAMLDQVRSLIGDHAAAKSLSVEIDAGAVPARLRGDPTRLRQALLNYAANAVKFTEHGHIALRARLLEQSDGEALVRFEVTDTGIGIEADKIARLFEPFVQADVSTTRRFGGTGLGLAITRRLASLMGGTSGAEGEPGKGSTFWFTARFRLVKGDAPAAVMVEHQDAEALLRSRHEGTRVLLAEDNPINREVAIDLLEAAGLQVDTAEDGRQAVDKAGRSRYALILMDMQMPEMGGLDATRAIRALPGYADVPILAMTANVFEEDRRACLDAGMNDFVGKPVDPAVLHRVLLKWLGTVPAEPAHRPASAAGGDLLSHLSAIDGLDLTRGLSVVRNRVEKYAELLKLFLQSHGEDASQLRRWREAGDLESIGRLAHALKGAAGNIGATSLFAASDTLLAGLRSQADRAELEWYAERMADELARFAEALRRALAGDVADEDLLAELDGLVEADPVAAGALIHREAARLGDLLGNRVAEVAKCIENGDAAGAHRLLRRIMGEGSHE